jgi:parallel beta-helix repeat protein
LGDANHLAFRSKPSVDQPCQVPARLDTDQLDLNYQSNHVGKTMQCIQSGRKRSVTGIIAGVLAICAPLIAPCLASATSLPGTISSNTTLTKAASPYYGGTTIESGVTLTAEPGVEVRLGYGTPITVNGTLKAEGTSEEPVVFTSESGEGYFAWQGLAFNPGSGASVLRHAEVRYAGRAWSPAIEIKKSSPTIEHSTIRNNNYGGIYISEGGSPAIAQNTFIDNGVYPAVNYNSNAESSGEVDIHDNTIKGGYEGIAVYESGPVIGGSVGGNTVEGTVGVDAAIRYNGDEFPADLDENTLKENTVNGIAISGTISKSMTWTDHGYPFLLENDVTVGSEGTLSVGPGFTVKSESWWSIIVKGTLKAEGTAEDPVFLTTNTGFKWPGLVFKPGSGGSVLRHVEVTKAGRSWNAAITIDKSSPTIEDCAFREIDYGAIRIPEGGSPEIAENYFYDSGVYPAVMYNSDEESSGEVNIHDNTVKGGDGGIDVYESGPVVAASVGGNTVEGTTGVDAAIRYGGDEIPGDLDENTLKENKINAISIRGTINKSMTWTDHGYPFLLENDVTVGSEGTLSVGPGFTVKSESWWSLIIKGTLKTEGTEKEPVVFTSNTTYNWPGLVFKSGSTASVLDHAEVRRAGVSWGSAITIDNASPTISNSRIRGSYYYGIFVKHGGAPDIGYNRIENNGSSGVFYGESEGFSGAVNIHDNILERNDDGISVGVGGGISAESLSGNTLRENSGTAISYSAWEGGEVPSDLTDNQIVSNPGGYIHISGTLAQSGTWSDLGGPINIGTLTVASGATLTVQPGVAFKEGQFIIEGALKAMGTEEEPVLFTPAGKTPWAGLSFESGSGASVLDHVEIVRGGYAYPGKAITIKGSSPTITHSAIRESGYYGIYVASGSPTIEENRFRKNPMALVYEGEGNLSAPNNDWGCEAGPGSSGCDEVSNVEWKPALTFSEPPPPCSAGSKQPGPSLDCLLYRYAPELKYDSQESYLANSVAEITDNWGDESGLWGESENDVYSNKLNTEIVNENSELEEAFAYARPSMGGTFHLTLDSLDEQYPNTFFAGEDDWLDEAGEDYAEDDHNLVAKGYLNRSYGRVAKGAGGSVWLQYWYFYYYNSFEVGELELNTGGLHEGDWEEIQIGLDKEFKPETVILSAHAGGGSCSFEELEKGSGEGPVVYVALDSHANYPEAGTFPLYGYPPLDISDHANGEGPAITPSIEVIGQDSPSWVAWPGHWGNSRGGSVPGEGVSPEGPMQHSGWFPDEFAEGAGGCEDSARSSRAAVPGVAAPIVSSADFKGKHPSISYELPDGGRAESGSRLILSVKEEGSKLPPLTKTVKRTKAEGEATLPFELNPNRDVVVLASVVDRFGHRSQVVRRVLAAS